MVRASEKKHSTINQQLQHLNKEMNEKEQRQRDKNDSYRKEWEFYNESISKMKEDVLEFETKIEIANNTLSNLEKETKVIVPVEENLVGTTIIYPAFALSLILNLMMGGKLMSGLSNSADSLNEE